jgi:hypothetical protein
LLGETRLPHELAGGREALNAVVRAIGHVDDTIA